MTKLLIIAMLTACGGARPPLSGPVGLRFQWEGDWPEATKAYLERFAGELGATGYFDGMVAMGATPEFHVDPQGEVLVRMVAPGAELAGCAWHDPSGTAIVVAPRCATWFNGLVTRALSHELVELAADPGVDDDARELADACGQERALLTVAGRRVWVQRYMSAGRCVP